MKTKSKGKIIAIIILLILILIGGFIAVYLTTDLFKTNKQLFFKYVGQILDTENGFIDNRLPAYFGKKQTSKYEDSGKFYVDINTSALDTEALQTVNDFNIEYNGLVDNASRKNEQNISINYSEDVNFPIKYKYANDTLGIQTDYVSSKYIGVENKNLKELIEKFGITNTENVPDVVDFLSEINIKDILDLTEEEIDQLENTYIPILEEKIKEKEFGKMQENDTVSYFVEITNQELKELLITFLEKLKDDQIIIPKIENMCQIYFEIANKNTTEEITLRSMLEEYIDTLNSSEVLEGSTTIMISQTNGIVTEITLKVDENEFKIKKSNDQGILNYTIELNAKDTESEDTIRYFITLNYQGLEQLETVNETYQLGIITNINGEEQKLVYNLNSTDTFKENISIADYTEDEIQVINEYDAEQILTLIMNIAERIEQVNKMQMEEIGFSEYGNPIMYAFPST